VVRPETGRTHQAARAYGCGPVIPSWVTASTLDIPIPEGLSHKLHLHARKLEIPRPGKPPLVLEADLSPHMADSFTALGFDAGDNLMLVEEALE
jgi:hypothetical protein